MIQRLVFFAASILLFAAVLRAEPPYRIKDQPYINKNFDDIYFKLETHNHGGEDSVQLNDVTPSTGATYSLGTPALPWKDVRASSSVTVSKGSFTAESGAFYCKTSSTGFVSKSESGTCYAIRVHNNGALFTVAIPCPN